MDDEALQSLNLHLISRSKGKEFVVHLQEQNLYHLSPLSHFCGRTSMKSSYIVQQYLYHPLLYDEYGQNLLAYDL